MSRLTDAQEEKTPEGTDLPDTQDAAQARVLQQLAELQKRVAVAEAQAKASEQKLAALAAVSGGGGTATIVMRHCNTCGADVTDQDADQLGCPSCPPGHLINALALDRYGKPFIVSQARGGVAA